MFQEICLSAINTSKYGTQQMEKNGTLTFKLLHSSTFRSVYTCRRDFLKRISHDKNLSVSKYLHVKTATESGECVKTLMKGGEFLIEPCGCISLKSTSTCCGQRSQIDTTPSPRHLAPDSSHSLKHVNIIVGRRTDYR